MDLASAYAFVEKTTGAVGKLVTLLAATASIGAVAPSRAYAQEIQLTGPLANAPTMPLRGRTWLRTDVGVAFVPHTTRTTSGESGLFVGLLSARRSIGWDFGFGYLHDVDAAHTSTITSSLGFVLFAGSSTAEGWLPFARGGVSYERHADGMATSHRMGGDVAVGIACPVDTHDNRFVTEVVSSERFAVAGTIGVATTISLRVGLLLRL